MCRSLDARVRERMPLVPCGRSVGWPELDLRDLGIAPEAQCNRDPVVGHPGVGSALANRAPRGTP